MRKILMLVTTAAFISASMVSTAEARNMGRTLVKHPTFSKNMVAKHNTNVKNHPKH